MPDYTEKRIDTTGRVWGPRQDWEWQLSYDEKQLPQMVTRGVLGPVLGTNRASSSAVGVAGKPPRVAC